MIDKDKFDQEAEALLPCQRPDDPCQPDEPDSRKCRECYRRPAVAARLREDGKEIERLKVANEHWHKRIELTQANEETLTQAQAEIERLQHNEEAEAIGDLVELDIQLQQAQAEIAALRSQLAEALEQLKGFFDYRYDDRLEKAIEILERAGNNGRDKIDQRNEGAAR